MQKYKKILSRENVLFLKILNPIFVIALRWRKQGFLGPCFEVWLRFGRWAVT